MVSALSSSDFHFSYGRSIIQDSDADWAREAATMSRVYRNGLFTIADCVGVNSSQGLFTDRNPCLSQPLVIHHEYSDQKVKFTALFDWENWNWDTAPLYKRGWAFQERILSTRTMHFSKFPVWDCGEFLNMETYPWGMGERSLCFPSFPVSDKISLWAPKTADEAELLWWRLVKLYTRCKLTYESDKLIALSGIASALSETIGESYLAGIWGGKYTIVGLGWRVCSGSQNRKAGRRGCRGISSDNETTSWLTFEAPSWSWASQSGSVYLPGFRTFLNPLIHVVSTQTTTNAGGQVGHVSWGKLVIRGILFKIPRAGERWHKLKWKGHFHLDCESARFFKKPVYFLPLAEVKVDKEERSFAGIYLQKYTKDSDGSEIAAYVRIGDCFAMSGGGDGFMLDNVSWSRLLNVTSADTGFQEIVIV
jgi:hypothetical protein